MFSDIEGLLDGVLMHSARVVEVTGDGGEVEELLELGESGSGLVMMRRGWVVISSCDCMSMHTILFTGSW